MAVRVGEAGAGIDGKARRRRRRGNRRVEISVIVLADVDAVDLKELAGMPLKLGPVVEDLDPVAGREAEDLIAAKAEDGELARGVQRVGAAGDRGDAGADGGVVARPFEGGGRRRRGVAAGPALVDLDAVDLVFDAGVAGARSGSMGLTLGWGRRRW